jgi:hypothetical protein
MPNDNCRCELRTSGRGNFLEDEKSRHALSHKAHVPTVGTHEMVTLPYALIESSSHAEGPSSHKKERRRFLSAFPFQDQRLGLRSADYCPGGTTI